jgi:hypothetical protein
MGPPQQALGVAHTLGQGQEHPGTVSEPSFERISTGLKDATNGN